MNLQRYVVVSFRLSLYHNRYSLVDTRELYITSGTAPITLNGLLPNLNQEVIVVLNLLRGEYSLDTLRTTKMGMQRIRGEDGELLYGEKTIACSCAKNQMVTNS